VERCITLGCVVETSSTVKLFENFRLSRFVIFTTNASRNSNYFDVGASVYFPPLMEVDSMQSDD